MIALIMIENLFKKTLQVRDFSKSLLKHFQDNEVDWMQACGGKGRCTTCKVIIQEGEANFGPLSAAEEKYFKEGALMAHERLACQARIKGDVSILVPEEYKLPHMRYSDEGKRRF